MRGTNPDVMKDALEAIGPGVLEFYALTVASCNQPLVPTPFREAIGQDRGGAPGDLGEPESSSSGDHFPFASPSELRLLGLRLTAFGRSGALDTPGAGGVSAERAGATRRRSATPSNLLCTSRDTNQA